MIIFDDNCSDWKVLQNNICNLLNEVGIQSNTDVVLNTPRGIIAIDVYGIDRNSVDEIKYIIECKSWNKRIPKSVVHSFITVMSETGGNIGYIISNKGLQRGALEYLRNTPIKAFTFEEFQERYFETWFVRFFCQRIYQISYTLQCYIEPFNSRRERCFSELTISKQNQFKEKLYTYEVYSMQLATLSNISIHGKVHRKKDIGAFDIEEFKVYLQGDAKEKFHASNYKQLLNEFEELINKATEEFNEIFGKNIFNQ